MKFKILFFILGFLTFQRFFSQSYSFKSYSIAEGLAQTQVRSIAEDKNGYLWIGTIGGLSCFNGATFKNYSSEDGLFNNRITALFAINDELWIGHEGGISLYKGRKFQKWSFGTSKQNTTVSKIVYFKNKIVIGTNGEGIFVLEKNKLKQITLYRKDENRIRDIELINENLYFATRNGLVISKDLIQFTKIKTPLNLNLTAIVKKEKALFVSTTDGKIYQYSIQKKIFKLKFDSKLGEYIDDFIIDEKSNIWAAFSYGLIYKPANKIHQVIQDSTGLPFNQLMVVFEDKNGTIWIGSDGKGLFRLGGTNFNYYNQNNGIGSNLITSAIEVRKGEYFFGSYDQGLIQFKKGKFINYPNKYSAIWALKENINSKLWLGTNDSLVSTDLNKSIRVDLLHQNLGDKITCFYTESKSKCYFGTSKGIGLIYNDKIINITKKINITTVGTIRSIVRFKEKIICASDGGVFEFKNGNFIRYLGFGISSCCLKIDDFNNLWCGSEAGLYCSDNKSFSRVFLSKQPASNVINFINYHKGQLFVGTNNGLYVLQKLFQKEKSKIKHFGIEDGLINLETNLNSSLIDSDGNLWFGTADGLVHFDLQKADKKELTNPPNLNVIEIKVNYQSVDYKKYSNSFDKTGLPRELILPPNKNNLLIELDGVMLKNHSELQYEYRIEGLTESWVPGFKSPQINLSNLPAGSFTLFVRVKTESNVFSNEYQLDFTVKQIFYKTWWFVSILILLLGFFVYYYFKSKINREKEERYKENLEFKSKLISLEQQSLNASMNRHFIFNSLNSIQYFINTQDKLSANKYLTNFAKLIRKNLDSASDNNNQIDLFQEIERLELYLSLESMRFKDRFEFKIITNNIDLESIEVPAMLFQPFVENAIIHGILPNLDKKGLITINLELEENIKKEQKLIVSIEDNGVGIDKSIESKTKIEGDHKSQGMEITAKRISLLNKLSRQDFELEGPFQIENENRLISGTRVLIKIPLKNH